MEIIKIDPAGDYERYENLILQKNQYEKDGFYYEMDYDRIFGELLTKSFELKIDCIALKKKIALFIQAQNQGRKITEEDIRNFMEQYMRAYQDQLKELQKKCEEAKKCKMISSFAVAECKTIYRRLARKLHPDMHPEVMQDDGLLDLFTRIMVAYECNDLKELQRLEVLANRAMEERGMSGEAEIYIPDIQERIAELEEEIDFIVNNIPYAYKEILENEEAQEEKKKEIREEIEQYLDYKKTLEEKLEELKKGNA